MIDGIASEPFSATTLPPITKATNSTEKVIKVTRERYSQPIDEVEDKIARWSGVETEAMVEKVERDLILKQIQSATERKIDFLARINNVVEEMTEEVKQLEEIVEKREKVKEEEKKEVEKAEKKDELVNIVTCDRCGQKTKINFNPNPDKPLFCKECLKEYRREQAQAENAQKAAGHEVKRESRGPSTRQKDQKTE